MQEASPDQMGSETILPLRRNDLLILEMCGWCQALWSYRYCASHRLSEPEHKSLRKLYFRSSWLGMQPHLASVGQWNSMCHWVYLKNMVLSSLVSILWSELKVLESSLTDAHPNRSQMGSARFFSGRFVRETAHLFYSNTIHVTSKRSLKIPFSVLPSLIRLTYFLAMYWAWEHCFNTVFRIVRGK